MRVLVIDNYDSFTYNLVHYLGELGAAITVKRNDDLTSDDALAMASDAIVLSPGPCTPNEAGICLDLIEKANGKVPILGVCLGHQSIGQAYGGTVLRANDLMHGKVSTIDHTGSGLFDGVRKPLRVTRYHSLTIEPDSVPDCLTVTASASDGTIMGLSHKTDPVHGVQFHPESIASEDGHKLLRNFLDLAKSGNRSREREMEEHDG
ncbi:MAG: aminodeoxychorismate/anthranilate synthase component II [Pseudomonadota bacterium]